MRDEPWAASLEEARRDKGLSRRALARAVLASESSVRRWEHGERAPRAADVLRLATVLEVPVATVWSWMEMAPPHGKDALSPVPGLRRLRLDAGLGRPKLAAEMGVSAQTVAHWECGRRALPCHRLDRLAIALEMTRSDLVRELTIATAPAPPSPLRRMRTGLGLSQREAATQLGISSALLGRWESGRAVPSWPHIRCLARVYGLPVDVVARGVGQHPPALLDPRRWTSDDLGAILRALRVWRGETLGAVAERIGVHGQTLRGWEQGRSIPTSGQLTALQSALGLGDHLPLVIGLGA